MVIPYMDARRAPDQLARFSGRTLIYMTDIQQISQLCSGDRPDDCQRLNDNNRIETSQPRLPALTATIFSSISSFITLYHTQIIFSFLYLVDGSPTSPSTTPPPPTSPSTTPWIWTMPPATTSTTTTTTTTTTATTPTTTEASTSTTKAPTTCKCF